MWGFQQAPARALATRSNRLAGCLGNSTLDVLRHLYEPGQSTISLLVVRTQPVNRAKHDSQIQFYGQNKQGWRGEAGSRAVPHRASQSCQASQKAAMQTHTS